MKVLVAQPNAKTHFLVPRALERQSALAGLAIEWYAGWRGPIATWLRRLPFRPVVRAMGAWHPEVPLDRIYSQPWRGLLAQARLNFSLSRGAGVKAVMRFETDFAKSVKRMSLPEHDVFFGYSYASLEMLEVERARGIFTVLDQIDLARKEAEIVAEEIQRWPLYGGVAPEICDSYFARAHREWELADLILIASEWLRTALLEAGVPAKKLHVLPLAYELSNVAMELPLRTVGKRLRVLWLGSIILRKGIQYLVEAARLLQKEAVDFTVAGPLGIRPEAIAAAPRNIEWCKPVPRAQLSQFLTNGDLFVFPTLSDGFGMTQLEAMAHGLPVITTPNCGQVVQDGKNGFIIPARDPEALAEAIRRFIHQPELIAQMRPQCLARAKEFNVDDYGKKFIDIVNQHRSSSR